ncbi:MAG UNVERIFIED_CONTAM: 4Fe-4S binding protein [Anaerolineae bacterium]
MLRCIFCGYCEDACPTQAIQLGHEHRLSFTDRRDAIYVKNMLIDPAPDGQDSTPVRSSRGAYTRPIPDMQNPMRTGESESARKRTVASRFFRQVKILRN